jgi:hypothetical protein
MLNVVVPNVVLQAFSILIPIAKWDLTDAVDLAPHDFIKDQVKDGY